MVSILITNVIALFIAPAYKRIIHSYEPQEYIKFFKMFGAIRRIPNNLTYWRSYCSVNSPIDHSLTSRVFLTGTVLNTPQILKSGATSINLVPNGATQEK